MPRHSDERRGALLAGGIAYNSFHAAALPLPLGEGDREAVERANCFLLPVACYLDHVNSLFPMYSS